MSKPASNESCVVLVPVGNRIEPACEAALRELERRGYAVQRVYGFSAIDQGRNVMATRALDEGFEEMMWIDADVAFHPQDVERLRRHQLPLCCGIYPKKGQRAFAFNFLPETQSVRFGEHGGLQRIDRAGMGFVHTRRAVYERIVAACSLPSCNEIYGERMLPFFQPMIVPDAVGHSYLPEDFAFCERARQAGIEIVADTSIRLWHIGSYPYGWEDAGREVQRFTDFTFHITPGNSR
ncbi:MAG: hypothetical protein U0168_25860 [Nannocystaceae bacterium]